MVAIRILPAKSKRIAVAKGLPVTLEVATNKPLDEVTIQDVKKAVAQKFPRFYPSRQKLTVQETGDALGNALSYSKLDGLKDNTIYVKDLGPQMSWRTVFFIEYAGPLLMHPIFYYFPQYFYSNPQPHSDKQKLVFLMVMLHFVKRELETAFVHRFSHDTMPRSNLFRNSAHYWFLSGLGLAYEMYHPMYSTTKPIRLFDDPKFLGACAFVWLFAEIANLHAHITLKNLRSEGTTERAVPRGFMFEYVSCANYFFEILAWTAVQVMTGSIFATIFLAFSGYTMTEWAKKKHRRYKQEFPSYPNRRKAIIPFLI